MEDLQLNVEDAEKELNGEGEPVWLTPHLRDPQPEGERENQRLKSNFNALWVL